MPIRLNAGVRAITLLSLFSKRIRFAHGIHEFYPYWMCRIRVCQDQLRIAPKVERINCIRSIDTSSNTDSCIEHPLSKSTRSPYPSMRHIIKSTMEITALKTTNRSMITARTDIDCFIIQLSTLMAAEKSSETNCRTRRVTGNDDNYHYYIRSGQ